VDEVQKRFIHQLYTADKIGRFCWSTAVIYSMWSIVGLLPHFIHLT